MVNHDDVDDLKHDVSNYGRPVAQACRFHVSLSDH
jgi:hypothetical protein